MNSLLRKLSVGLVGEDRPPDKKMLLILFFFLRIMKVSLKRQIFV